MNAFPATGASMCRWLLRAGIRAAFLTAVLTNAPLSAQGEKPASIALGTAENDSEKTIVATVTEKTAKSGKAVAKIEVSFFASRLFGLLPLGERAAVTDENGRATAVFPVNLPGDKNGNVVVVAKIVDNDDYADTEARITVPWGTPVIAGAETTPRELWAPHAPLWLILVCFTLVGGVWIVFLYVIRQLHGLTKSNV
jgi:hypothetical protein